MVGYWEGLWLAFTQHRDLWCVPKWAELVPPIFIYWLWMRKCNGGGQSIFSQSGLAVTVSRLLCGGRMDSGAHVTQNAHVRGFELSFNQVWVLILWVSDDNLLNTLAISRYQHHPRKEELLKSVDTHQTAQHFLPENSPTYFSRPRIGATSMMLFQNMVRVSGTGFVTHEKADAVENFWKAKQAVERGRPCGAGGSWAIPIPYNDWRSNGRTLQNLRFQGLSFSEPYIFSFGVCSFRSVFWTSCRFQSDTKSRSCVLELLAVALDDATPENPNDSSYPSIKCFQTGTVDHRIIHKYP